MRVNRRNNHPTDRAKKWAAKLSYEDRLQVRELLFKLYSVSEDIRFDRNKNKVSVYPVIDFDKNKLDDKTIKEWQRIEKVIKQAEEQFMEAQLAEDAKKMIKDFNEKGKEDYEHD